MSKRTVQQVKALITADLSVVEKAQLVEWLGADLRQALLTDLTVQPQASPAPEAEITPHNSSNTFAKTDEGIAAHELPWEEQPWTTAELRELRHPDPKTGAEIAELIDRLDLRAWKAMDIPDVVEWLNRQRQEEMQRRVFQWLEAE